jgi:hypothetical protein
LWFVHMQICKFAISEDASNYSKIAKSFWKRPMLGRNHLCTAHLQILNARHRRVWGAYGVPVR